MPASPSTAVKRHQASEVIDVLLEMSTLLNCNLTRGQLAVCVSMIEHGTNPEALAAVIKELHKEAQRLGPPPPQKGKKQQEGESTGES